MSICLRLYRVTFFGFGMYDVLCEVLLSCGLDRCMNCTCVPVDICTADRNVTVLGVLSSENIDYETRSMPF